MAARRRRRRILRLSKAAIRRSKRLKLQKVWGKRRMKRPSPPESATAFKVGARKQGNDRNLYVVVADQRGRHRWTRLRPKKASVVRRRRALQKKREVEERKGARRQRKYDRLALEWAKRHPGVVRTMRRAPSGHVTALSRRTLIARIRVLRDGWEGMTTRNQDLSDERLADESLAELRQHYAWFYSREAQELLERWLAPPS